MNRRSFFQRLALWFASLPVVHFIWSRPARSPVALSSIAPVSQPAAVQNEVSEYMQQAIDEAFTEALANNRESWYKPPRMGDFSGAVNAYDVG